MSGDYQCADASFAKEFYFMDQGRRGSSSAGTQVPLSGVPELWDPDVVREMEITLLNTNICSIPVCLSLNLWPFQVGKHSQDIPSSLRDEGSVPSPGTAQPPWICSPAAASYFFIQGTNAALGKCPDANNKYK